MRQPFKRSTRLPGVRPLAWLLSAVMLAQAFMPLQAHSRFVTGEDAQTVLICILDGYKSISLDQLLHPDAPADDAGHNGDRSAAMLFSQLLAEGAVGTPILGVQPMLVVASDIAARSA